MSNTNIKKPKIKICIANYGSSQLHFMKEVIREFESYKKYEVDVTVYTTVPVEYNHIMYHESVGMNLPFMCRKHMAESINDYDLFLYNENDHLITEDNIDAFMEHNSTLKPNQVSGFIRYEQRGWRKILCDLNPGREFINGKPILIKNRYEKDFSLYNNHQGSWLLTKEQLKTAVDSGKFVMERPEQDCITTETLMGYWQLEQGATHPYIQCGLEKVFPKDQSLLKRLLIWHMPLKYTIASENWLLWAIPIEEIDNY
jgi:hypothetical protein